MFIGGFQKFTMLDYPGKIAAVVFTMGCNFRCPYCHNPELVDSKLIDYENEIKENDVLKFLDSRKGDLDGICITGGEPTLQLGLKEFIKKIKKMGFSIKLDTNASHSSIVSELIEDNLVDYWAIDIKTTPEKYKIMTKKDDIIENIEKSISLITGSCSELELRTTVAPGYVNQKDFDEIINWINGIDQNIFSKLFRYSIQNFRPEKTLHNGFENVKPYEKKELEKMSKKLKKYCGNVVVLD
ncbi:MAG: anaerobic ribonucleoside-triphosphate reductase activating protein [Candidatus Pacebacteria bacterium]|nr:anaerobic ribonucleoside-triphosphate reductase activating protein [Candidatus Paceibacterota bacterium]